MNRETQEHFIIFCRHDISNMIKKRSQVEKHGLHQEMHQEGNGLCKPPFRIAVERKKALPVALQAGLAGIRQVTG